MWRSAQYNEKLRERLLWAAVLELIVRPINVVVSLGFAAAVYWLSWTTSDDPILPIFWVAVLLAASFLGFYFTAHRAVVSIPLDSYLGFAATADGRLHTSAIHGNSVVVPAELKAIRKRGSCWVAVLRNSGAHFIPVELLPATDVATIRHAMTDAAR